MKQFFFFLFFIPTALFGQKTVNVYVWGGEIPKQVVREFELETGIKVNFSTYDSNETMYAKLKASRNNVYDVILPSGYYVERMKKLGMLTKLNHANIPNLINLEPMFVDSDFDPKNQYSIPLTWGATGIFYNKNWIKKAPKRWGEFWEKQFKRQLLLLDDAREVFSIALMSLGYSPNDHDAEHIKAAYEKLLQLTPNIKLFASESIQAIMIDEDANAGSVWNGDAFKARLENNQIEFVYPEDGFVIWSDCLAIPRNPPHAEEAYQFINFLLKPEIAKQIALLEGHAITNAQGKALLPETIRNNPLTYPSQKTLERGYFQRDVGDDTVTLYNQYWEQLKLAF
ncbi:MULTISPECIES: ABC transporter substrate-binding protein [Legionella]|uniref:Putrescine-binding periplasmic protein n=1 Tax=Legionella septentrionalis TaxID=2498109 RepID=A0A3S1CKR8_9GAMM|nr:MULTISPECIES: spermidine/putrescine ABC transporter substrate-binding protein [Legionella]MCP0912920.1 spermidine/putrescine ABC transporter substrate-binding protein [Legionella sp. 27cVA30]RUQ84132.1 spermidine/putrescine ABC transporter substrate-binding protein [Legionella septentrionalis]RUR10112.1 spermidine/putrescine ABC transporter substrate-binding protein [Legionella septentrionalis]RUR15496.1 spermidine/putrescine ABC transporter substrate-binding protein [Legionella septentriona